MGDISAILYEIVVFIARAAIGFCIYAFLVVSFVFACDVYEKIKKSIGGKKK